MIASHLSLTAPLFLVATLTAQDKPLVAQEGGALTAPRTLLTATTGSIRDQVLFATGDRLHLYVLMATDKRAWLVHLTSSDQAKTWSPPTEVGAQIDNRSAWVKAFAPDGSNTVLLLGTDPALGPQTPRITHFLGKKYTGFVGKLTVVRLGKDGDKPLDTSTLKLENPGTTIHAHHAFRPAFQLAAHGDRLTLAGTTWFHARTKRGQQQVWSLVAANSIDKGKTWSKFTFQRKAYSGLRILKPAFCRGSERMHAVFGDRYDKKLAHVVAKADGTWEAATSNIGTLSQWNFWYDALDEGKIMTITDTIEVASKPKRFGIVEFTSQDSGQTWQRRRTIDLQLDRAYAAASLRRGRMRAHVAWHTAALSLDDGANWMKATVPGPFRNGRPALIPGRGLALTVVLAPKGGKPSVQILIYSP